MLLSNFLECQAECPTKGMFSSYKATAVSWYATRAVFPCGAAVNHVCMHDKLSNRTGRLEAEISCAVVLMRTVLQLTVHPYPSTALACTANCLLCAIPLSILLLACCWLQQRCSVQASDQAIAGPAAAAPQLQQQWEYYAKWKEQAYPHCSWIAHSELMAAMKKFPGLKARWQRFQRSTKTKHAVWPLTTREHTHETSMLQRSLQVLRIQGSESCSCSACGWELLFLPACTLQSVADGAPEATTSSRLTAVHPTHCLLRSHSAVHWKNMGAREHCRGP